MGMPVISLRDDLDIPQSLRYLMIIGSAQVTGGPPGLQIQCGGLIPSQVGSIPMHFRQKTEGFRLIVEAPLFL